MWFKESFDFWYMCHLDFQLRWFLYVWLHRRKSSRIFVEKQQYKNMHDMFYCTEFSIKGKRDHVNLESMSDVCELICGLCCYVIIIRYIAKLVRAYNCISFQTSKNAINDLLGVHKKQCHMQRETQIERVCVTLSISN